MKKKTAAMIFCVGALLSIGALPLLVGVVATQDFHGRFRVNYLRGLSTILGWTGAEFGAYNLDWAAHKIELDLQAVVVTFQNEKEENLVLEEAERIEPRIGEWGRDIKVVSSGEGFYRFYLPPSEFTAFEQAIVAYKATLESNTEQAGTGQLATRPEPDLEGSYKPQPEAEERSR